MAGGNPRGRMIACIGAFLVIGAATATGLGWQEPVPFSPYLFASTGTSAVLIFATPTSPLGHAWPFAVVAVNAAALMIAGWSFHRFTRHAYPHRAKLFANAAPPTSGYRSGFGRNRQDVRYRPYGCGNIAAACRNHRSGASGPQIAVYLLDQFKHFSDIVPT